MLPAAVIADHQFHSAPGGVHAVASIPRRGFHVWESQNSISFLNTPETQIQRFRCGLLWLAFAAAAPGQPLLTAGCGTHATPAGRIRHLRGGGLPATGSTLGTRLSLLRVNAVLSALRD